MDEIPCELTIIVSPNTLKNLLESTDEYKLEKEKEIKRKLQQQKMAITVQELLNIQSKNLLKKIN